MQILYSVTRYIFGAILWLVGLGLHATMAEEVEYRFERMVPQPEPYWNFSMVQDIAMAPDGSLWLASGYNRFQHINANGSFIAQFGNYGTDAGPYDYYGDIAVATDGSVWITSGSHIQHFTSTGTLISDFESPNSTIGNYMQLSGIAVSADNSIWVLDGINRNIQHFKSDGGLITQLGSEGTEPGQFSFMNDIAIAPDGSVWVADTGNHRIQHFDANGKFINLFGGQSVAGQAFNPKSIAVAADRSVWVADLGDTIGFNTAIEHFTESGSLISRFTNTEHDGIALAADGSLWVAGSNHIQHVSADGAFIAEFGSQRYGVTPSYYPTSIAATSNGSVWVVDTANDRIQNLNADGSFIAQFTGTGIITVAADDSVWLASTQSVQHFQADGRFIAQFGSPGDGPGQFGNLTDIAIAGDGSIWIAEGSEGYHAHPPFPATPSYSRIQHFMPDGSFIGQFGSYGAGTDQFYVPKDIAVASDGSLWVTDGSRIHRIRADGHFIAQYGSVPEFGQLGYLNALALGRSDDIWVLDALYSRIQQFTTNGNLITQLGSLGNGAG